MTDIVVLCRYNANSDVTQIITNRIEIIDELEKNNNIIIDIILINEYFVMTAWPFNEPMVGHIQYGHAARLLKPHLHRILIENMKKEKKFGSSF